ncbi:DNA primase family protein [Microbacterium sp. MC2]
MNDDLLDPTTHKPSATRIAAHVAATPTPLGRGVGGEMYEYRDGVFVRDEDAVRRRVAAELGDRYSATLLGQVDAHLLNVELPAVGLPELPSGYLDYIVLDNGIYWWKDDEIEPHSPALGALTKLPITHDPTAIPHTFSEWLGQVLPNDADLVRHVWEIIGYLLMTGNPLQKIFLLHGAGGNGKGTFMRVIRALLGRESYSSISMHQLVDDRFATAGLYGKIANISGDLSSKFLSDPQILKEITGGDSISASRKFGQSFEFVPYAVPLFASNNHFRTSDNSAGWRRRWEVIDFTVPVEDLAARGELRALDEQVLLDDAAGIFNVAMDGLRRLMARGRFDAPAAAREATDRLHDADDPLLLWLDEDEGVYLGELQTDSCTLVYQRYRRWCLARGYRPLADNMFGRRLIERVDGITRVRRRDGGRRGYWYEGIGVEQTVHDDPL